MSHTVTEHDELVFGLQTIHELGSIAAIEARAAAGDFTPGPLVIVKDRFVLPTAEADHD